MKYIDIILLLFSSLLDFIKADCLLCESGVDGLKRPRFIADAYGTRCAKKMHDIYLLEAESPECTWETVQFREMCCGDEEPPPVRQIPTQHPAMQIEHTGHFPQCDICWNHKFPGTPAMVINMLNVGVGSCRQFFEVGRAGLIVPHYCDTLQYFAYEPCGCSHGEEIPSGSNGIEPRSTPKPSTVPTKRPTAPPTKAPTKSPTSSPTTSPTSSPTLSPTNSPTASPTHSPTASPTANPTTSPTSSPTISPTTSPTASPTQSPTKSPTRNPTSSPTGRPSPLPSTSPSIEPSQNPTRGVSQQRVPDADGKEGVDPMRNGGTRGGQGGQGGVRFLKGSRRSRVH